MVGTALTIARAPAVPASATTPLTVAPPDVLDIGNRVVELGPVTASDDDASAFTGERAREFQPDAGRAASHDWNSLVSCISMRLLKECD